MMRSWTLAGILATLVILAVPPLYLVKRHTRFAALAPSAAPVPVAFTGSTACRDCHRATYDRWQNSHHDNAMDRATDETVRADFNDTSFELFGVVSRFYRRDGRFWVHTQGPQGEMGEFEITHTFGYYPLQQYLVPFPGGRLQCLSIVWDVERKEWFHLYPDEPLSPDSWFFWTNQSQNWNGMCAECHTTNFRKNYDPVSDTFQTEFNEMDVGCEACHGPGAAHVAWAELPAMGRPDVANYALTVDTSDISAQRQVELCAPCHARRQSLTDNPHQLDDFMDYGLPRLLNPGLYFADGQILDEVYVYGSFVQSKMYDREVRCSDCHDVHSIKRLEEGNALCLTCHRADLYDTKSHHFHKQTGEAGDPIRDDAGNILFAVGSGARCEACHMPGRHYMGIDYRPDHSFRVPRPDLTREIGAPNACNRCHQDKSAQWSTEWIAKWYGTQYKLHYGTILAAGRNGTPGARGDLIRTYEDDLLPPIVRATALYHLAAYQGPDVDAVFTQALMAPEALIRQSALANWNPADPRIYSAHLPPLLYDPVKAVRIEAANRLNLAGVASDLKPMEQGKLATVLKEYEQSLFYSADLPAARHNLGNYYAHRGEMDTAEKHYQKSIQIDPEFYPAQVNLAMLYNQQGKNRAAEELLRDVVAHYPDMYDIHYSLGLLLAEEKQYEQAVEHLAQAARGMPQRARIHYNRGLLLAHLGRDGEAESALRTTLSLAPENQEFHYALVEFLLKRNRFTDALPLAENMVARFPHWAVGRQILAFIHSQISK